MRSILDWSVQNLDYMVGCTFVVSIISLFFSLAQIRKRKKLRAIVASAERQIESGVLTVRLGSEMPQIRIPIGIAMTRQLHYEQAGLIYYSLAGLRLPYEQSLHSSATAEGKIEQTDEIETSTSTLATLEGQLSPPGQSARNPNVALKESIGMPNDLLCRSGV